MADQIVLSMALASTLDGTEQTYGTQGGADKRISVAQILGCFKGYLAGLTMSNSGTTSMIIAAGCAVDSTNADIMVLPAPLTKTMSSWSVGNGGGALDIGTIADATYFWYLIKRPDTGVVDVLMSRSATIPVLPTNYTLKRRIGAAIRVSSTWQKFVQIGDDFFIMGTIGADGFAASSLTTRTQNLNVPTGIQVLARFATVCRQATAIGTFDIFTTFWAPDINAPASAVDDEAHLYAGNNISFNGNNAHASQIFMRTDTSGNVNFRSSRTGAVIDTVTMGWRDTRGRF